MKHKGYSGKFELDEATGIFHGEVLGIKDVITFQGTTAKKLLKAFRDSVDDYLEFCEERGEDPDKPYSGNFMLRMPPELHRRAAIIAEQSGTSLNTWLNTCISALAQHDDQMHNADASLD